MFLPTTTMELQQQGIPQLDIILITGDAYIDSPHVGVALIGKLLTNAGYFVGIIAQPDVNTPYDISRLGEPRLFWGVTGGCIDSMVANYTAVKKRRKSDDYTPNGINIRRPDRAVIVYSNLIRRYFKHTKPIVLGGLEASLRRIAHYDYWSNEIRRSILFDAKADILIYGMAEIAVLELAHCLSNSKDFRHIRGICYKSKSPIDSYIELPSYEDVKADKTAFISMFKTFYDNNDPLTAKGLCQRHAEQYLIQNPPSRHLSPQELDAIYELQYERDVHPFYKQQGTVKTLETIKNSITTHRGCYGECNFCAISVHQGNTVVSRSIDSIVREVNTISNLKGFAGYIHDLGGPTANMYGIECSKKLKHGKCQHKRCLYPKICPHLNVSHNKQIKLLKTLRHLSNIKKVFVSSGIRYDMIMQDVRYGLTYLQELIKHHISGQLKIAPEHSEKDVLELMGKQDIKHLLVFKSLFDKINQELSKKQFLTYYFMVAHPGCSDEHMIQLKGFITKNLKLKPEQAQIFTPTPSTYSTLMYYTEINPFANQKVFVQRDVKRKERQKCLLLGDSLTKNSML